ncbi:hypothetical protein K432DRAFT_45477 [Lepidopterella palustris CBS 459.81]|uniref:Uncharacterized protein n=1 Tax=Lepidopterella palustris CBS 459.81 TaxID=1314670 RepID=A0A8E2JF82_9PEZI|nr:hypothetical protein K432DRAFT_45477 [Lepidopterella palustris CBS 459.81]
MADQHILQIPAAAANDTTFIIVNVISKGPRPLDLKLLGSEGEAPYVREIKHRSIKGFKTNKFNGTDEQWEAVLSRVLLQKTTEGDFFDGIDVAYSFDDDEIQIIIRKNIVGGKGLKVTWGNISLAKNEEEEINLFEWVGLAAQATAAAQGEMIGLKSKLEDQRRTIEKLNAQLEDLIRAKEENDNAMLGKFTELLNEKKLKIRDQQRLLAGAKVGKAAATNIQAVREETTSRKAAPSRASKRKANGKAPVALPESSEDEFEKMQVDEEDVTAKQDQEEDTPGAVTPDRVTDDETEDEDDIDIVAAPSSAAQPPASKTAAKGKAVETTSQRVNERQTQVVPPPRRELPFGRAGTRSKPEPMEQKPLPAPDDDETANDDETEDDEL